MPHSKLASWSAKDLQLHIADLMVRDDIGPCGQPHSVSTLPGARDRYTVDADTVCGACAVEAEHRKTHEQAPPGTLLRVVDVLAAEAAAAAEPDEFGPQFA